MKITLRPETLGSEILQAICNNRNARAKEYNRKKAAKYLTYCEKHGTPELIAYARKLSNQ